jgi:hypothetical protein
MSAIHRTSAVPGDRTTALADRRARTKPAIISAWAIAALVAGDFAFLAAVPVVILAVTTFRNARLRALRWWAVAVATTYGSGLVAWALGPDREPSLSKDLHPAHAALIVIVSIAFAIRYHRTQRRGL